MDNITLAASKSYTDKQVKKAVIGGLDVTGLATKEEVAAKTTSSLNGEATNVNFIGSDDGYIKSINANNKQINIGDSRLNVLSKMQYCPPLSSFVVGKYYMFASETLMYNPSNSSTSCVSISLPIGQFKVSCCVPIFTLIETNGRYRKLGDGSVNTSNFVFSITEPSILHLSVFNNQGITSVMLVDSASDYPSKFEYGVFSIDITNFQVVQELNKNQKSINEKLGREKIITVKKDGTGDFTSIVKAVNSITDSNIDNVYDIYIYDGIYDIIEELGGDTYLASITDASSNSSGLRLPKYVNLIGKGNVELRGEIPDEKATLLLTTKISTINLMQQNKLENLKITAHNMRYTIHDETGNYTPYTVDRVIENCYVEHYGNKQGMWVSAQAYGCGTGSNGKYLFKDCIFKSKVGAFSIHNNANQLKNIVIIEGCSFEDGNGKSIRFSSFGDNTEKNIVYLKSCYINNGIYLSYEQTECFKAWDVKNFTKWAVTEAY